MVKIWLDADACPKPVREIVFRASERLGVPVCLVANSPVPAPESPLIEKVTVPPGVDEADEYIAHAAAPEDIVVTADIPLAAAVVRKGAVAIDIRGQLYSAANVGDRLALRNLLSDLRSTDAMQGGGPPPYSPTDRQRFASALDRTLTRILKKRA